MSNAKIVHLKASQSVFAAAGGRIGLFGYEEEAGTMRFQYGASPTVDVAYAALRNSPNTFSGANTFQSTVTARDFIVRSLSSTNQSIGYLHSTTGNLRLIHRFDEVVDSFDFVTRNDDGTARNTALRIPRTTATAVNAGGSGGQPWNFTGGVWTGGTQRISSAGRFDAASLYNSAWAGSGVRPLLTDNAGMGYATDAATFRGDIGTSYLYDYTQKYNSADQGGGTTEFTLRNITIPSSALAGTSGVKVEIILYMVTNAMDAYLRFYVGGVNIISASASRITNGYVKVILTMCANSARTGIQSIAEYYNVAAGLFYMNDPSDATVSLASDIPASIRGYTMSPTGNIWLKSVRITSV